MKSRVEKCVLIGRSNGVDSVRLHATNRGVYLANLYGYLIVPIENIIGLKDSKYMSIEQISEKIDEIGGVVQVDLRGARKND
jgi:hypothetical protein